MRNANPHILGLAGEADIEETTMDEIPAITPDAACRAARRLGARPLGALTVREYLCGCALRGIAAATVWPAPDRFDADQAVLLAERAVLVADALLRRLASGAPADPAEGIDLSEPPF